MGMFEKWKILHVINRTIFLWMNSKENMASKKARKQ